MSQRNCASSSCGERITERQLIEGTLKYYTGPGICPFLGTANTMGALCESLGMMLPGGSLIPSSTSMRRSAQRIRSGCDEDGGEADSPQPDYDTGGAGEYHHPSFRYRRLPECLIHLPALAAELGISLDWDDFSKITTATPVLCSIVPNGNRTVVDLHYAGGIPAVMKELESVMNKDVLTVTGETLGQILERTSQGDREVIKSMDDPVSRADGIQVLYGNLAPQGALVKTSAVPMEVRRFKGTARVFEGEDECYAAFRAKEIKEGDALLYAMKVQREVRE